MRGIPSAPLLNIEERFADEHFQTRECFIPVEHAVVGTEFVTGVPWRLVGSPAESAAISPVTGPAYSRGPSRPAWSRPYPSKFTGSSRDSSVSSTRELGLVKCAPRVRFALGQVVLVGKGEMALSKVVELPPNKLAMAPGSTISAGLGGAT